MPIHLEIVTAERTVLTDDVDQINAPGAAGRMGMLPHDAPVMASLVPGELTIIKGGERIAFAVSGGFMEVLPDRVTILADTAERGDEIDEARAEAARRRAASACASSISSPRSAVSARIVTRSGSTSMKPPETANGIRSPPLMIVSSPGTSDVRTGAWCGRMPMRPAAPGALI